MKLLFAVTVRTGERVESEFSANGYPVVGQRWVVADSIYAALTAAISKWGDTVSAINIVDGELIEV